MPYNHNINACILEKFCTEDEFSDLLNKNSAIVEKIRAKKDNGELPLLSITESEDGLDQIEEIAEIIRNNYDHLYVLGTGGSSLTGQALVNFQYDFNITFVNNVDPHSMDLLLSSLDYENSFFLVISKSGNTLETLSQFFILKNSYIDALGEESIADHFMIITDPKTSILRNIGEENKISILDHEAGVGGRFSIFTNVALLPACVAGLDIRAIRQGAKETLEQCLSSANSESLKGAILHDIFLKNNINMTVFMPYIDRLTSFTEWVCQIWAESLGKDGKGSTPIRAYGTLDQHSQLQLYLGGPQDKWFSLFTLNTKGKGQKFPQQDALKYLNGKAIGDVISAEQQATEETIIRKGSPVRNFEIDKIDAKTLGALSMHMILETLMTAELWEVNPLDQPAVEEGKIIAHKLLSEG